VIEKGNYILINFYGFQGNNPGSNFSYLAKVALNLTYINIFTAISQLFKILAGCSVLFNTFRENSINVYLYWSFTTNGTFLIQFIIQLITFSLQDALEF
jgi:hypothetical protein